MSTALWPSPHTLLLLPWMPESYLLLPQDIQLPSSRLSRLCPWIESDQINLFLGQPPTQGHKAMEPLAVTKGLCEKESYVECLCAKPLSRSWSITLSMVVLCHMESRMAQGTHPSQDPDLREVSLFWKTHSFTSLKLGFWYTMRTRERNLFAFLPWLLGSSGQGLHFHCHRLPYPRFSEIICFLTYCQRKSTFSPKKCLLNNF